MRGLSPNESAALRELKATLIRDFRLVELRLFGSKARGDSDKESDIDVLVVLEDYDWETRKAVSRLCFDINIEHGILLVPVLFSRTEYGSDLTKVTPFYLPGSRSRRSADMSSPKHEVIRYRMERAREALNDAQSDLEQERLNSASNRIYYAMFYAAIALPATRDLSSSRHSGIISLFYKHFVRSDIFPAELAQHLGRAFEMRTNTDYRDFSTPERAEIREMFEQARAFVQKAEDLVRAA